MSLLIYGKISFLKQHFSIVYSFCDFILFLIFMKNFQHFFISLFTLRNIVKVSIIFSVGLFSRFLVNYFFDINVFSEFTHYISLVYYFFFSSFIVYIDYFVSSINFNSFFTTLFIIDTK